MPTIFMPTFSKSIFCLVLLLPVFTGQLFAQPAVAVASVKAQPLERQFQLTGNVVSSRSVGVASEVSASVAELLVEVGDVVSAGQPLARLRDQTVRLQLAEKTARLQQEQAALTIARLEEQRLKKLLRNKSVSVGSYDQAAAQLQQAEARQRAQRADIAVLEDQLQQHQITAPFAGVITDKSIEVGGWVARGATVMGLAALDPLRLELAVPQQYFAELQQHRASLRADISADHLTAPLEVPVQRLVKYVDDSRSFSLWFALPADNWLPGMLATATLRWQGSSEYPMVVPSDALVRQPDGGVLVWKISTGADNDKTVSAVVVAVGQTVNGQSAVRAADLVAGDQVVVRGNEALRPNQIVRPLALGQ